MALFQCNCGCGQFVKSQYAPGHDARHAGRVARAVFEKAMAGEVKVDDHEVYAPLLPSGPLRIKARAHAMRLYGKKISKGSSPKKAVEAVEATEVVGMVKAGRWEYPAKKTGFDVVRNTKRDGSGTWIAADGPFTAS